MRVTNEMMVTGSLRRLQNRLERYERAQMQLSTGKVVNRPSDDPSQASRGLVLRAALRSREQETRAITDATAMVNRADGELQSAQSLLQRIRELTVRGATDLGQTERNAIAEEIGQLQQNLLGVANTRHAGRPLFAGFSSNDAVAFQAGAWTYQGDNGQVMRRLTDADRVPVNVRAEDVFGFGGGGTDTFTALDNLQTALRNGDTAAIQNGLNDIDAGMDRLNEALATLGAVGNRVEAARRRNEDAQLDLRTQLSDVEDLDIAEGIMNLQIEEVAYQATLQALGRSLPDTLVSFLR